MLWFAVDPGKNRLTHGEEDEGDVEGVCGSLRNRNLEPLLVVSSARWEADLAGGPEGLPPRPRTAAELAAAREQDPASEVPKRTTVDWAFNAELDARRRGEKRRVPRPRLRPLPRRGSSALPRPRTEDADGPPALRVRIAAWADGVVSVALVGPGAEALPGTERLFPDDAGGSSDAGSWCGQLEAACDGWARDGYLLVSFLEA